MKPSLMQSAISRIARSWDSLVLLENMQQAPRTPPAQATAAHIVMPGAGLLQSMPGGWLHQLIRTMTAKERLVLFKVNRQLSRQVVASSPHVVLQLDGMSPKATMRQCAIFISLLKGRRGIEVEIHVGYHPQPFPAQLLGSITVLNVEKSRWAHQPISSVFCWSNMQQLRKLKIQGIISAMDLTELCDALTSGHLQHLHFLSWDIKEWSTPSSAELLKHLLDTHFTQLTIGDMTFEAGQFMCSSVPQSVVLQNSIKADIAAKQAQVESRVRSAQDRHSC